MWGSELHGSHRIAEDLREQPLAKVAPQILGRVCRDYALPLVCDVPSWRGELVEKRLFDVKVFGHGL